MPFEVMRAARPGRSSAPAPARPLPPALRLQRAIGNRATAQLLRQVVTPEADLAAERERFDKARAEHQQRLKEIDALDRPHVLKDAGVTTDSHVDDKTAGLIQEHGLSKVTNHNYWGQLACAQKLVAATSFDMVARAYFQNDPELRETLRARFKLSLGDMAREMFDGKFCARL